MNQQPDEGTHRLRSQTKGFLSLWSSGSPIRKLVKPYSATILQSMERAQTSTASPERPLVLQTVLLGFHVGFLK